MPYNFNNAPERRLGSIVCDRDFLNEWADYERTEASYYVPPALPTIPIIAPHTLSYTFNGARNFIAKKCCPVNHKHATARQIQSKHKKPLSFQSAALIVSFLMPLSARQTLRRFFGMLRLTIRR